MQRTPKADPLLYCNLVFHYFSHRYTVMIFNATQPFQALMNIIYAECNRQCCMSLKKKQKEKVNKLQLLLTFLHWLIPEQKYKVLPSPSSSSLLPLSLWKSVFVKSLFASPLISPLLDQGIFFNSPTYFLTKLTLCGPVQISLQLFKCCTETLLRRKRCFKIWNKPPS